MEASRVQQSQKCSADTFRKNWRPFIDHAVKLINSGKAHDGYSLLKAALQELGRGSHDEGELWPLPRPVHAVRGLRHNSGDLAFHRVRQGRADPQGTEAPNSVAVLDDRRCCA